MVMHHPNFCYNARIVADSGSRDHVVERLASHDLIAALPLQSGERDVSSPIPALGGISHAYFGSYVSVRD